MAEELDPFAHVAGQVDYGTFSFTAARYVLADLCEKAAAAISSRDLQQRPDLGCFQVRVGGPDIYLRVGATDQDRVVLAQTEAVSYPGQAAQAYIPARRLLAMLREAPEGDITVSVAGNKATVAVPGSTQWHLPLPGAAAYPPLPSADAFGFQPYPREQLLAALKAVRHAVCRDGSLANLTQVSVAKDNAGQVNVTATDGNRCARVALPDFPQEFCIPSSVLDDALRLLSSSPVSHAGAGQTHAQVGLQVGHVLLAAIKRGTPFPDVDAKLLKQAAGNDQVLAMDKDELAAAIRRVRINASADSAAIALELSGSEVTVLGRDGDSSAAETVKASWDGGQRLVVTSHVWLSEALAAHPDQSCELRLGKDVGKRRSVIYLTGGGVTQVISQLPPQLVGY